MEKVVRKFGWSSCLRYVGEKMGLEKIFASGDTSSKGFEGESTIDMTVRAIVGAVYLDAGMSGVQKTLGHWDEILADVERSRPEEISGTGWLDVVMGRKDEDEGSKSGGDKANPDVGLGNVEKMHQ